MATSPVVRAVGLHRAATRLRAAVTAIALAAVGPALSGCGFAGDPASPSARPTVGRVAMAAQIVAGSRAEPLAVRVTSGYVRAAGDFVALGTQTLALTEARTQQVPVTIDLAACLNDPARRGADQGTGADAVCYVQLTVVLLSADRVLDTQVVGPLVLWPGGTVAPDRPLALYSVSTVRVAPVTGTAPADGTPYRLEVGQTLALAATVQDAAGQPVADRPAHWTSDAPAVAQVDSLSGVVTPVAPGRARITASAGGRDAAADVLVVPAPAAITVAGGGTGSGRVTSTPAGLDCRLAAGQASGACTVTFPGDAAVTLTAVPDAGSSFAAWGGDCTSAGGALTCPVAPTVPRAVVATFTAFRALAVTLAGPGGGDVTSSPAGVACQRSGGATTGACTAPYLDATSVTLTPAPDSASTFAGWSGACAGTGSCTVALDQARAVTGTFARRLVTLTLALGGAGEGSVSVSGTDPCTLDPGQGSTSCTRQLPAYVPVTLTPAPGSASQFQGWSGACAGTGACTLTPGGDATVGAVFTPAPVGVSVAADGRSLGNGGVASAPGGVACTIVGATQSGACASPFAVGATVTLTATPATGFAFAGWAGACAGATGPTCALTVGRTPLAATVRFTPTSAVLTLAADPAGTGTGQAFTSDERLACAIDGASATGECSETYTALPATVVLRASHDPFNAFVGWSGVACAEGAASETCTVTLVASATARANFRRLPTVTVTPSAAGAGSGTLTVTSPIGFSCTLGVGGAASACQFTVPQNATVTFGIVPDANTAGFSYGGACAGQTGQTCTFTATGSANPTVTYTPRTYGVTVSGGGSTGTGSVTSTAAGINCTITSAGSTGTCSRAVNAGSTFTLTAAPGTGSTFNGWGGDCAAAGTNPTCTLANLQAARSVSASFGLATFALTASQSGFGSGVLTAPAGIGLMLSCLWTPASGATDPSAGTQTGRCSATYAAGTSVVVTANPTAGGTGVQNAIGAWTGACAGTAPTSSTCTVAMTQARTVGVVWARSYTVTAAAPVDSLPTGGGVVTSSGINCTYGRTTGNTCAATFAARSTVTLTANHNDSSYFAGWVSPGTVCAGVTSFACAFTAAEPDTAVARFDRASVFELDAGDFDLPNGQEHGRVTVTTLGRRDTVISVSGGDARNPRFGYGRTVRLQAAAPNGNYQFVAWSGDCEQPVPGVVQVSGAVCTLINYSPVGGESAPAGRSGIVEARYRYVGPS